MEFKSELDDVGLTLGMLMSKVVRRCRGDEIGYANNRLPLCMRNRMADHAAELTMEWLRLVTQWESVERRMAPETMEDIFAFLIKRAAEVAIVLESYIKQLDASESPLHIIRDKRIR